MSGWKQKSNQTRPDMSRVFALAGEINRLLSAADKASSRSRTAPFRRPVLPASAFRALGAANLDAFFSLHPEKLPRLSPESIPQATARLDKRLDLVRTGIEECGRDKERIAGRLQKVRAERAETDKRSASLQRGLSRLRAAFQQDKAALCRREAGARPGLSSLEARIKDQRQLIDNARRAERRGRAARLFKPEGYLAPKVLAERQAGCGALQARLEKERAALDRARAGLEKKAAGLVRFESELERLISRAETLRRHEDELKARAKETDARLSSQRRELEQWRKARAGLDRAGALWPELKSLLLYWPQTCARLDREAGQTLRLGTKKDQDSLKALRKKIGGNIQTQTELARSLDNYRPIVSRLVRDFQDFDTAVQDLGADIDKEIAAVRQAEPGLEAGAGAFHERLQGLDEAGKAMLTHQSSLAEALAQKTQAVKALEQDRLSLVRRQKTTAQRATASIRALAAKRKGLAGKTDRLYEQLAQFQAGLPLVLGPTRFLDRCVLAGALGLVRTRKRLQSFKETLGLEHDRLSARLEPHSSSRVPASTAGAEADLARVRTLAGAEESTSDLAKRLADLGWTLAQAERIRKIKAARRKDQDKLGRLSEDRQNLIKQLDRAGKQVRGLAGEKTRLANALAEAEAGFSGLTAHLEDEVYPLLLTLGRALHQDRAKRFGLEKERAALAVDAAGLKRDKESIQETANLLSRSLSALSLEMTRRGHFYRLKLERTGAEANDWQAKAARLDVERQELETDYLDSVYLGRRQSLEIEALSDHLAGIYPLLDFFLEQTHLWGQSPAREAPDDPPRPEGSEYLIALVHILDQENETLKTKLKVLLEDRRALNLEQDHLSRSHKLIKERLKELLPVFSFCWQSWFKATAGLTEAQLHRRRLTQDLAAEGAKVKSLARRVEELSAGLAADKKNLALTSAELNKTLLEKDEALRQKAELGTRYNKIRAQAQALQEDRTRLSQTLKERTAKIRGLKAELETIGSDNQRLESEERFHRREARTLAAENKAVKAKLAEDSGRLEAVVSGLGYVAQRSEEELAGLRGELAAGEETIRDLKARLAEQTGQIENMESVQDRLGLLVWMIVKFGGSDERVWEALVNLGREKGFRDAAGIAGRRLHNITSATVTHLGSEQFRRAARRAVQRGFYSLVLAGGLVLTAPEEPSKATSIPTILPGAPENTDMFPKLPAAGPFLPQGPFYSAYVGRTFDLSSLAPSERAKGFEHLQKIIAREIDAQAGMAGLEPGEYIDFVCLEFEPNQTISLEQLKDRRNVLLLVKSHFPSVYADLKDQDPGRAQVKALHRLARAAGLRECRFWDRLYTDFRGLEAGPVQSLDMVLNNIRLHQERRGEDIKPAFTGRLRPIPALEKMSLAKFSQVLTPYFKDNIKAFTAHEPYAGAHMPGQIDFYARCLAEDMYVAGKIFGVPMTVMVSIAHQETYFANVLGDNLMSASPFQIYRPTKGIIIRSMTGNGFQVPKTPDRLQDHLTLATYMAAYHLAWLIEKQAYMVNHGRDARCNIDLVARAYNGGEAYPGAVYRKKLRLLKYLKQVSIANGRDKGEPQA